MAYTLEQIEWLHDNGKMPDWAYYQQNGKSAQQNFVEATKKARERILKEYYAREEEAKRKEEQKLLEKDIEKQIETKLEKVLDDLLKRFGK